MNRYLLLRDNKQTGPYTVAELIEKGIKAYDLVWLDGRSAAWRYPSEIEELKAYAPVVEEQPFDRFYKKPSEQKKASETAFNKAASGVPVSNINATSEVVIIPVTASEKYIAPAAFKTDQASYTNEDFVERPVAQQPTLRAIPAIENDQPRKIYVNMPGAASSPKPRVTAEPVQVVKQQESIPPLPAAPIVARINVSQPDTNEPVNEKFRPRAAGTYVSAAVYSNETSDAALAGTETTARRTLADTRFSDEGLTGNYGNRTVPKPGILNSKSAMTAIAALCLLLGGVVIGLVISNNRQANRSDLSRKIEEIRSRESGTQSKAAIPAADELIQQTAGKELVGGQSSTDPEVETEALPVSKKPLAGSNPKVSAPVVTNNADKKSTPVVANSNPAPAKGNAPQTNKPAADNSTAVRIEQVPVRNAVVRDEKPVLSEEAESTRKNIRQLVSVQKNNYKTGVLGGISDLELTLLNKSDFEIDMVEVEVTYFGPERRVINTQTVVFNNIKPGKQLIQDVPRTKRGVTVNASIRSIQSKSLGLAYSGL